MEEEIANLDKTIQNVHEMGKIYKSEPILTAVDNYYKLKSKYEMTKKNKCIFCGNEGSTIFKTRCINGNKTLIAECKSSQSCSKNIKILTGKIENFHEKISLLKQQIEKLKLKIIIYKNDILFGYVNPEKTDKFQKIMNEFDFYTLELKVFMDLYSDIIENQRDYDNLKKLESDLYIQILNIKRDIINYNNEKHTEDLDDAVNIFVDILSKFESEEHRLLEKEEHRLLEKEEHGLSEKEERGLLEKIMLLKYVNPSVEYDEKEKTLYLIQIPRQYDIYSNEFSTLPIEVITNEKLSSSSPRKSKTLKTKSLKTKSLKTLKTLKTSKSKSLKSTSQKEDFWEQYLESDDEGYIPQPKITITEDTDIIHAEEINDEDIEKKLDMEQEEVEEEKEKGLEEEEKGLEEEEFIDPIYTLIDRIPSIVENDDFYDKEIEFVITTKTTDALPGKAQGETIPAEKEGRFDKLSKVKNWRYHLSNYGIGEYVLDGKTWKTIEHYYQASKFKKNNPQFYNVFSLDYREPVEGYPDLIISENATLAKYAGTTGIYNDKEKGPIRIRPEGIEPDDDFFLPDDVKEKDKYKFREKYELFIAQQTKFNTNEKMKKILKATKNAKLKYNDNNNSANNIMYIRSELQ
jgi:hypothetical protein